MDIPFSEYYENDSDLRGFTSPYKAIKDMIKVVFHLLMKRFRMISRIALIEGLTDSLPKLL